MGRMIAILAVMAALLSGTDRAKADGSLVMVELFTSQGCHSCPPADAYLGQIAEREDVIALSMHVDYWDYLGWRDIFGQAAHTKRQRAYAATLKERMVYTPQVVVQGRESMVGSHTVKVEEAIQRHAAAESLANISLTMRGDRLVAEIAPVGEDNVSGDVMMVWFSRAETVVIRSGENGGRDLTYHNVVKGWSDLGRWRGGRIAMTTAKPMEADGVAVFVQAGKGGPILAAAKLTLP